MSAQPVDNAVDDDADPKWVAAIRQAATPLCPTPPPEDPPE